MKKYIQTKNGIVRELKRSEELEAVTALITPSQKTYIKEQAMRQDVSVSDLVWALITKGIECNSFTDGDDLYFNARSTVDEQIETLGHKVLNKGSGIY